MIIRMNTLERLTLAEMEEFLTSSRHVKIAVPEKERVYPFIERVLKGQQYRRLSKGQKGTVKRFLAKVTGLSRAQTTRLIQRWMQTRRIERKPARRPSFQRRYTAADIASLAEVATFFTSTSGRTSVPSSFRSSASN